MTNAARMLELLYATEGRAAQLDLLYDWFDDAMRSGCLSHCEEALRSVDLERVGGAVMLGFLIATFPSRNILPTRSDFVQRVEARFRETAPDRVDALMGGLR